YTAQHVPHLSPAAQGLVGIVGAKQMWAKNDHFWQEKQLPLDQEIIFASTGTKHPDDPPWKYVAAFAGSDIETNPPATNEAVEASGRSFTRQVDQLPAEDVLAEIDAKVNVAQMERTLMEEGIRKFADPQKALLAVIAEKREALAGGGS
ncbi:MAG: transaldolase family protein, partial [Pirellulales bacterium]